MDQIQPAFKHICAVVEGQFATHIHAQGMTMTQKILARAAGVESCKAGELLMCKLDLVLGNDITGPVAINEFEKMGATKVFDPAKIALIPDHFVPNKDIKSAENCKCCRDFANANEIVNYFDVGNMGIEHALLPEKGLVTAGDAVICTLSYRTHHFYFM